ncbi:MAG: DUF6106 family protein [Christensenellales bacterium]
MDNFREEVAFRRKQGTYTALYYLSWAMIGFCGIVALISFFNVYSSLTLLFSGQGSFNFISLIFLVLFGGSAFLLWRSKDELRVEYEYTFTNGELDVSKVLNNVRRKYLTNMPVKIVESCGPVNTPAFQRLLSMKDVKKHNWFANRDAKLYYFYFTKNSVKHMIIVELSDEMIELVRKPNYMNYGIWQE